MPFNTRELSVIEPGTVITQAGSSNDIFTGDLDRINIDVNVTAISGSLTVILNRKGADGVYYPVYTTAAITTTGKTSQSLGGGHQTNADFSNLVQVAWTISAGTATISLSLMGK
jgi:hypothetical protein